MSRALTFEVGLEEQAGILLGHKADDENHSRLFGCASQNQTENSKRERKLKGTELRPFIISSLPM